MAERFKKFGYYITTDPQFQDEKYGVDNKLRFQLERIGRKALDKNNTQIIGELTDLIVKYPLNPVLKNYLSVAYNVRGNYEKATEINRWILAEHPDYLFARLNEANDYINREEYDKVPAVLGEIFEIKALYPEREMFHLSEITGYLKTLVRYFAYSGEYELAENRLEMLREIAPGHPDLEDAQNQYTAALLRNASKRFEKEEKLRIKITQNKIAAKTEYNVPPVFTHSEINLLYGFSIDLPGSLIDRILKLPREPLISDLEKMLDDAVMRYGFFLNSEENESDFLIHAFVLLAELQAEESLPKILEILEYDSEFLDFWLGDHISETVWHCIYKLGQNQTGILKEFLLKPGIDTYAKLSVTEVFSQLVLHQPERSNDIETIFAEVFNHFLEASPDDNLVDSAFLGMAIGHCIDAGFVNLLPVIKKLFEKEIVDLGINGDYNETVKHFNKRGKYKLKKELLNIHDLYSEFNMKFGDSGEYEDDFEELKGTNKPAVSLKIGRNDPCPCGSGLKYKKCCGK